MGLVREDCREKLAATEKSGRAKIDCIKTKAGKKTHPTSQKRK